MTDTEGTAAAKTSSPLTLALLSNRFEGIARAIVPFERNTPGALVALKAPELNEEIVAETLGCFLKDESDVAAFKAELPGIISG